MYLYKDDKRTYEDLMKMVMEKPHIDIYFGRYDEKSKII